MISVCIATYNGERYLKQQLESILTQLSPSDEIIVSDDGSSDSTLSLIESIGDNRIKTVINNGAHGVNTNFRNAISHAKGDIIFFSDQDDVWLKGKVKKCLEALKESDCVVHDCIVTDSDLSPTGENMLVAGKPNKGFFRNLIKNRYTGCCMCIRRSLLKKIPDIPDSTKFYYDQWIGLWSELNGNPCFINDCLIYFRRHADSKSSAATKSALNTFQKIHYRVILFFNIFRNLLSG